MNRLLLSFAGLAVTVAAASATPKSWTAVKGSVPDTVNVVVGADLAALRATSIYKAVLPTLIAKEPDLQQVIDLAKEHCAIDLHAAFVDATAVMGRDERGIIVATLDKSIDQKRILECLNKRATTQSKSAAEPGKASTKPPQPVATVTAKTTGKITEYTIGDKHYYAAWLAADIVAMPTEPDDRALLAKMLGGKGTKGAMARYLAKASPKSTIWLATTKSQPIQTGGTMKGAYGTIDAAKGDVAMDMNIVLASADEAKAFVDQMTALIAGMRDSIPPQFQKLVDALKLAPSADAANMKLTAAEKDVLGVITLAMSNL